MTERLAADRVYMLFLCSSFERMSEERRKGQPLCLLLRDAAHDLFLSDQVAVLDGEVSWSTGQVWES